MTARLLLCIFVLLDIAVSFEARANTLIIALRTEEASIIAADSKFTRFNGHDSRSICKIRITDNTIWATTGLVRNTNGSFDIWEIADSAIKSTNSFDDAVSKFEHDTLDQLRLALPEIKQDHPDVYKGMLPSVAEAIFIKDNIMKVSNFLVPDANAPENIEVAHLNCPGNCVAGRIELFMGVHAAAASEFARDQNMFSEKGTVKTLDYLMNAQITATPESVAGPITILRMDKSGALSWLQNGTCN